MEKGRKNVKARKTVKAQPKKKNNYQMKATIMGVAMIVAALVIGIGTYAYYVSSVTGTVSGTIDAWSFIVNTKGEGQTFTATMGDLKPGVSGSFNLILAADASDLDVDAVVSFSNTQNWPTKLKLYTDSSHASSAEITVGTTTISRTITHGTSTTVPIYYYWDYAGAETPLSTTTDLTASVDIEVVGTQSASYAG